MSLASGPARHGTRAGASLSAGDLDLSSDHLDALFAQAPVAIAVVTGPRHTFRFANQRYLDMVQRQKIVGQEYLQVFPELAGTDVVALLDHVYTTGEPFETDAMQVRLDTDGSGPKDHYYRFNLEPLRGSGRVLGLMAVAVDVTDHVVARKAADDDRRILRTTLDSLPVLAWTAQPDGWIDFYNRRWYEYTGTSPDQMVGWGWQSVHDDAHLPRVLERWKASIETGEGFEMSFPLRRSDGTYRWHLTRVQPVRDARGDIVRWVGTNTDVDDQVRGERRLEASLEQERAAREDAERLVRFSEMFVGILGHDLRNPLSAAATSAQLIQRLAGEDERLARPAERVVESSRRMARMIDQLLDFTRIRLGGGIPLDIREVDLVEVCRRIGAELDDPRLHIDCRGDAVGWWDTDRLAQLVSNLASNALQHGTGNEARVAVDGTPEKEVVLRVTSKGEIPEAVRASIFDPFKQANAPRERSSGLGLGLYISQQIAKGHGGHIQVDVQDGWTTFEVRLPRRCDRQQVEVEARWPS